MFRIDEVAPDVTAFVAPTQVFGVGLLHIDAFLLHSGEPMLVDTGPANRRDEFLDAFWSVIDPEELRWIWITHMDQDHVGNVHAVLEEAPNAQVITNYTGLLKMATHLPLPVDRVRLVNPGETLSLGDRTITAWRPPLYDAPETTGLFDPVSGALFSSDCFGAMLQGDSEAAEDLTPEALVSAVHLWTSIDTPWITKIDRKKFEAELDEVRALEPSMILSGHMPPAKRAIGDILDAVASAPEAAPFVGPNHAALVAMLGAEAPE